MEQLKTQSKPSNAWPGGIIVKEGIWIVINFYAISYIYVILLIQIAECQHRQMLLEGHWGIIFYLLRSAYLISQSRMKAVFKRSILDLIEFLRSLLIANMNSEINISNQTDPFTKNRARSVFKSNQSDPFSSPKATHDKDITALSVRK